ncbi:hypothetical protein NEMBOFW57_004552 [Staphylotrichum longicolle]|uniref:Transcription factor domain-containing protein n=1 Tax=Staphylotrichum longicolle TaxID=669026 RepID=A0AAD4F6I4_9PEZI|nr:hypothetical protein NEMBOFW57_004552 [Staphylotrichum longicolle]
MAVFMTAFPHYIPSSNNHAARVHHLCVALRLVNAQLSGRDAASNETMVVVLVLGLYERYHGEYQRGLMHLDGLRRMLDLRGGIRELSTSSPDLARKIFRTDLEYSLNLGTPPRFTLQDVKPVTTPIYHNNLQEHFSPPFHPNLPIPLAIHHLLRAATRTAHLLHTASTSPTFKLSSRAVHDTFILLGYRLQALSPLLALHTIPAAGDEVVGKE